MIALMVTLCSDVQIKFRISGDALRVMATKRKWRCQLQRYGNKAMNWVILRHDVGRVATSTKDIRDNINDEGVFYSLSNTGKPGVLRYDSDTILLTDNEILIKAASRTTDMFKVAVYNVSGAKKPRRWNEADMADLDIKTSKNLIGEIINLSQFINTLIWHTLASGGTYGDVRDIYLDVCKLSIASNIEIDKAKKEFVVDTGNELRDLRAKYKILGKGDKSVKPHFFAHIAKQKGFYNPERKEYRKFKTSMDYLQECVNSFNMQRRGKAQKNEFLPFSAVVRRERVNKNYVDQSVIDGIYERVDRLRERLCAISSEEGDSEALSKRRQAERQEFREYVGNCKLNYHETVALLESLEDESHKKVRQLLFYSLFEYPNESFYNAIRTAKEPIAEIVPADDGELNIYGSKFTEKI